MKARVKKNKLKKHDPSNYKCPICQDFGHPYGNPNEYCNCKVGRELNKENISNTIPTERACPDLARALAAICKLPAAKFSLKDSLAAADNNRERVALGCLESVERLALVGISGLHAVRYLRSVMKSRKDRILPNIPDPYTSPLLDALEDQEGNDGVTPRVRPTGSCGSSKVHSPTQRKGIAKK